MPDDRERCCEASVRSCVARCFALQVQVDTQLCVVDSAARALVPTRCELRRWTSRVPRTRRGLLQALQAVAPESQAR